MRRDEEKNNEIIMCIFGPIESLNTLIEYKIVDDRVVE
jgi:hypothetical protein